MIPPAFLDTAAALASGVLLMAGGAALILRLATERRSERLRRLALALPQGAVIALGPSAPRVADAAIPSTLFTPEKREVIRRLRRLGVGAGSALGVYRTAQITLAVLAGALALAGVLRLFPAAPLALALAAVAAASCAAAWAPVALVRRMVRRRAARVAAGLPDALELLVVCVEAGLSLEDGLARAVKELRHGQPALAEELALTAADLRILPSRDQALANLADRIEVPSVRSLVTTLSQTLRYGTPLAQAMRTVASELRDAALLRIEERANELPVMLTIPMMLFIMPTIFLIVGGPAGLRVADIFLR